MEDTTTVRPATAQGSSTAELVKHLSEQIGKLARDEVRLAQLEMMRAGKRARAREKVSEVVGGSGTQPAK
jgi:hypothetical protein